MKRERPADGGMKWHDRHNAFECYGCGEFIEIRRRADREPDKLALTRELLVADHTECWEFDDPQMARDARKYRTERKRRALLAAGSQRPVANRAVLDCSRYLRGRQ